MNIEVSLYGAFRQYQSAPSVFLSVPAGATIAALRAALDGFAREHWSNYQPGLLAVSAFASDAALLRDADPVPADGRVAVLPPVSGG